MQSKEDTVIGVGQSNTLKCNGVFTLLGGNPGQYKILRQQGATSGEVEFIDFAVYDTDGSTRLF